MGAPNYMRLYMKPEIIDTKLDGKIIRLKNCVPDDFDHNEYFTQYKADFPFPKTQNGHLRQYEYLRGHDDERFAPLKKLLNVPDNFVMKIGLHEMVDGGFIPPHDDGEYFGGLTIFLNKGWDKCWGGWAMAFDDNEISATVPEFGHGVFYRTPLQHCTSPIYEKNQARRTLQIFFVTRASWDHAQDSQQFRDWDE